jgi:hypothetical protein
VEILGSCLVYLSFLTIAVIYAWLLVITFRTSLLWGMAYIFIPFAGLPFMFLHWDCGKKPFLISLFALAIFYIGSFVSPRPVTPDRLLKGPFKLQVNSNTQRQIR